MADDVTKDPKTLEQQIARRKELIALREREVDLLNQELKRTNVLAQKVDMVAEKRQKNLEIEQAELDNLRAGRETALQAEIELNKEISIARASGDTDRIAALEAEIAANEILRQQQQDLIKGRIKDLKELKRRQRAIKNAGEGTKNILEATTGISEAWRDTTWGSLATLSGDAKGTAEAMDEMALAIKDTLSPANILGSTMEKVIESSIALAKEQDLAIKQLGIGTGQYGRYDDQLNDLYFSSAKFGQSTRDLGVSIAELSNTFVGLNSQVAQFSKLSSSAQNASVQFTSVMDKLGISNEAVAVSYDSLMSGLRMTEEESREAISNVMAFATEIGIPPQQMADDFAQATKRLSAYGKDMTKVFKKVAASAKALNLSTSELLGMMQQFDTFEGAATAVGNLNAVLGGPYLNSIQMVRMNEEERTRAMLEAMEMSGRSWEEMGKYERMAIANAAGIDDITTANKVFGQSLSAYDEQMEKAKEADGAQQDWNKTVKDMQTLGEKLTNMFKSLAVNLRPLVIVLGFIIDKITAVMNLGDGWVGQLFGLGLLVFGLVQALRVLAFTKGILATKIAALTGAQAVNTTSTIAGTVARWAQVAATKAAAAAQWMLNAAMSANPITLVILGVAALVAMFIYLKDIVIGVGKVIFTALTAPVNAAIWLINKLIDGANLIPFVDIPNIDYVTLDTLPFFKDGVTNFQGGAAVVGEAGPEVVTMGQGSNVVTNENVQKVMGAASDATSGAGGISIESIKAAFVAAIQETGLAASTPGGAAGKTIIMKLNDREFGRAVYEKMDEKTNIVPK